MPERPKRRKNNKNKRKNKNQRVDSNKNISDVIQTDDVESCSAELCSQSKDTDSVSQTSEKISTDMTLPVPSVSSHDGTKSIDDSIICFATENASQDLNNNSDVVEPLVISPSHSMEENLQSQSCEGYVVESPEQSLKCKPKRGKLKLDSIKSKSLDNDDAPQIVEISDSSTVPTDDESNLPVVDSSNILVYEVDTDVEWEKTKEFNPEVMTNGKEIATGTLSITTIPLNVAQCEQTKSLTPEEEMSLRHYLQTLNLSTNSNANTIEIKTEIEEIINREIKHRLRKKGLADDLFVQRCGPPRILDVIDEEGSSESSMTSRRQSYLSDKKSDNEDLEDDVFEDKAKSNQKYVTKSVSQLGKKTYGRLVPQQCMLVGTKLKEPEVSEARGDWTVQTVEKMTGAEVVYLTDSSSSTSSIHDLGDETDDSAETDVSIRIITPTIEVTDTEELLKKTFVSESREKNKSENIQNETLECDIINKNESNDNNANNFVETNTASTNNENPHEIVVLSTNDIKTNLYVKDLEEAIEIKADDNISNESLENHKLEKDSKNNNSVYNLELKVLKCELNDAINNLIKEVSSDSDAPNESPKENFTRQDSSSSVCSSQCTAKYNPTHSSLNDVSNMLHDENPQNSEISDVKNANTTTHVKDVFECVTGTTGKIHSQRCFIDQPLALRDLCVQKIANFPFGEKILQELASVSERLQNINVYGVLTKEKENITNEKTKAESMPYYPLPDLSSIEKVSLSSKYQEPLPPPVQPRNSSLKKSQDDNHWTALPSKSDPVYVCLSPSQKMLMEKTNTVITKEDATELIDTHKKFVDRRGYNENKIAHEREPPVVPFKSQTGSRLLALIRDPTVTYNINSSTTDNYAKSQFDERNSYRNIEHSNFKKSYENMSTRRDHSSSFKPIPPPRPKKYSSSFYESDESSDFTDSSFRSMKSERKYFHYSTGNLSKEIENDVSSIQNMHRHLTDIRDSVNEVGFPRRPSLPKDICDKQMEYIRMKEKEVEAEIRRLEQEKVNVPVVPRRGPRAPLIKEKDNSNEQYANNNDTKHAKIIPINIENQEKPSRSRMHSLFSSSQEELLRDKMYSEYVNQMAERQERKQHKIIKITNSGGVSNDKKVSKSMSALDILDSKVNNRIEKEFISKARERWDKLGIKDPETEDERESSKDVYKEPKVIEHKIKVIEGNKMTDVKKLPNHLQEFVRFTAKEKDDGRSSSAVWRPGAPTPPPAPAPAPAPVARSPGAPPPPPPPPVWTPGSAGPSPQPTRKTFRPVHFEETPPARRKFANSEQNGCTSGSESEGRLRTSQSAPATGLNNLGAAGSSRLPRAQNPTVTLLQKAREGQIPRGSSYLQQERDSARLPRDRPSPPFGDPVHALRQGYVSEGEAGSDYDRGVRKMADAPRKVEGIGPTTKDGMPVALRSEVKDPSRWYKKMYDTIHKNKYDDDYVTIRYKSRRGEPPQRISNKSQYAYFDPRSGYLSEPEGGLGRLGSSTWSDAYDSDVTSGTRRRTASVQEDRRISDASSPYMPNNKYSTLASARASQEVYKNQPGRIENYMPGRSSVVDKEAKQWWDEVMDIFDGQNISSTTSLPQASPKEKKDITSAILSKSNMARALKESGYESDSTLVFRRREDTEAPLSPAERRAAYRDLQAGGEPPLRGFRSPAPPRQDESEIEYIPISPTLTKIRVHKKTPKVHEVICYPVTHIETDQQMRIKKQQQSFPRVENRNKVDEHPPAPPRRISSRNSRTLQLVTASKPSSSTSPKRVPSQSNVNFLKNKISHKLTRQNTQILSKREISTEVKESARNPKSRIMSTSAPPAVNRKNVAAPSTSILKKSSDSKRLTTSSFGSPRRTLLPTEYAHPSHSRYESFQSSVAIEGGAGRRTPITNILDKVTSLDKLWSSEKRNERIEVDKSKVKPAKTGSSNVLSYKNISIKSPSPGAPTFLTPVTTHKSRDMVRTAEKVQKLKMSNLTKSNPCLLSKTNTKTSKTSNIQSSSSISKSTLNIMSFQRKQNQVKTATVTNLKKKKSFESVVIRPRSVPCHETCSKKGKEVKNDKGKVSKSKPAKKTTIKSPHDSESGSQFGDTSCETSHFGSFENLKKKRFNSKEIKNTHDAVVSDSFFQHLFLGGTCMPTMTYPIMEQNTTVLQKAKMFQSFPQNEKEPKSLNTYLIHRKPVSLSRFKMWDRYPSPSRVYSPRSISWPGRMYGGIRKFDSLSRCDEFGSSSSLATVRSKSEPPINKLYFSETSRPISPTVLFFKKEKPKMSPERDTISPSRLFFSQTTRPVSPKIIHKTSKIQNTTNPPQSHSPSRMIFTETSRPISPVVNKRALTKSIIDINIDEDDDKQPSIMYFSQTSRPVSPKVVKKGSLKSQSRSHSTSPVSIRSPSYRRIHNVRLQSIKQPGDVLTKHVLRTRSAGDADKKVFIENMTTKTKSDSNLHNDPDYDEYLQDMENTKVRSERFRELNRYYTYLERVGELEKATSTSDLRHRRRDEEIIDFDRWKKIRAIERAEEELNHLYYTLKKAQTEKDVLFYPRDVKDFRWNYDRDRGLRTKEKSVEDLKEHFQHMSFYENDMDANMPKDTYKPLWRGTSVAETAFNINRKNDNDQKDIQIIKPTISLQQDTTLSDLRKKIGLGNRLWSSLSMDQVNALKNQLNAIYSKELEAKANKELDNYTIDVTDTKDLESPSLHVRCNSLITPPPQPEEERQKPKLIKSGSIAAISCPITSVKELKNNVNKIQMSLSENEKRKISQTLSKEIMDRISKFDNTTSMSLKEEIENSNLNERHIDKETNQSNHYQSSKITKQFDDIIDNKENASNEKKRHIVYSNEKSENHYQSPASETDTASSDVSNKTVIYRGPNKEVQKKVEYFESVKNILEPIKTVHQARESPSEKEKEEKNSAEPQVLPTARGTIDKELQKNNIVQSQSCANFKELFGESEKNKFHSLPNKPEIYSRSSSPPSEVHVSDRRTPDTLRYSSDETIFRSRSPSPDPERYWRAYLNLARAGEVRRLARRFDSPTAAGAILRRHRSDPEIARNVLRSNWTSIEKSRREKMFPVARVPLRETNRFMPHIDIISKLAALRRRTAPRSRSTEETPECRAGEVDRIRRRFETMSLLGQIYASAPDMSELRDIAPYLAGPWIAHRYPKVSDNNRCAKDPSTLVRGRTSPIKREFKPIVAKQSIKLSSILKTDTFSKQDFDPSVHRPASRYEPPRAPPRPPPAAWPYRLAPYVTPSRHTVTFQESDSAPEPPRRASQGVYSDKESPRRYVESDVNIHYRCPVRHDPLPLVPERELARQQAEHMKRLYREQKRNKYLQELQDMQNRRHQDNFTPSQKNILPLNRYDEADRIVARALYAFNGQTARELSFRKGDLINVRRQIDANWYEGEVHGRIGLFPYNYVEIMKGDVAQSPKKPTAVEGRARAKFDFTAQTNLELPLKKGEVVVLTRRIDQNWWEGRNSSKTGIFPDSYVTVLQEPSPSRPEPQPVMTGDKPVASPAAHGFLNGSAKRSMGAHSYMPQPNNPALSNAPPATQPLPGYVAKPAQVTSTPSERGYGPPTTPGVDLNNTEPLYVDTNAEAVPYRAMYKYRPQNPDELELNEGDTVYVLEKCDDGWYVGSSQRTGRFGTFPGNYVERI